jgi:hypothetical protein
MENKYEMNDMLIVSQSASQNLSELMGEEQFAGKELIIVMRGYG